MAFTTGNLGPDFTFAGEAAAAIRPRALPVGARATGDIRNAAQMSGNGVDAEAA
jgi:hypothetical protein